MGRRILFATVGATPQILTETLWALAHKETPWIADEIRVVTTARGRRELEKARAAGGPLAPGAVPARFEVFVAGSGAGEVEDIESAEAAAAMANEVLRRLAELTLDPDAEIHVSIAGGRKTMSADAALAASLVCRPQDRVWHVLVSPQAYEANPSFWRPDQTSACVDRDGRALDPGAACVRLVEVQVPLWGYRAEDPTALEREQVVAEVNARAAGGVTIHVASNEVEYVRRRVELSPVQFALYRLLATARVENWRGAGPAGGGDGHAGWVSYQSLCRGGAVFPAPIERYIRFIEDAFGDAAKVERSVDAVRNCFAKREVDGTWRPLLARDADPVANLKRLMGHRLTRLRDELVEEFGPFLGERLRPVQPNDRGDGLRFGLAFEAREIVIREDG